MEAWHEMFWRGHLIDELTDKELVEAWRGQHRTLGDMIKTRQKAKALGRVLPSNAMEHFQVSCKALVQEMRRRRSYAKAKAEALGPSERA